MLTCLLGENRINCIDGQYSKDQLKKWANKNILLCPACGKPYEYCHGRVVMPYFRHKDKEQCEDRYSEPETQEHMQGKKDLYEWIKTQPGVTDAILEGWLSATKQRPDIMFKYNDKQCVLEYQCSPIASEYLERHELYQAAGIQDIWVLGTDKYLEKNENEQSKRFREKEIERYTHYYYDSANKLFLTKQKLDYHVGDYIPLYNYKNPKQRIFKDLFRITTDGHVVCRLESVEISKEGLMLGKSIMTAESNIKQEYTNVDVILAYAKKYLSKRFGFSFYDDRYNQNCIESNRLCFSIDVKRKTYRCFEKFFTYSWRGYRKWECNERNIKFEKVEKITWNSFIVFVVSILIMHPDYKQAIVNS